jgi:hypothetical protein
MVRSPLSTRLNLGRDLSFFSDSRQPQQKEDR